MFRCCSEGQDLGVHLLRVGSLPDIFSIFSEAGLKKQQRTGRAYVLVFGPCLKLWLVNAGMWGAEY